MQTGRRFADRYLLLGDARAGGMGTVHRAIDADSGATVALKIVQIDSDQERDRFEREATILGHLEHPGIVRYLAHGIADHGACYLAMDWVDGTTLADRLISPGLSARDAVGIARQLGETLAVVHRHGIVHRDIKPANIMLTGGDLAAVRLIDFGVARRIGDSQRLTWTGTLVGTPGYMSPEQARGVKAIDARADLFALGCVLYECMTGRPTFSGEHATAVRALILEDQPAPPRAFSEDISLAHERLVLHLLAKDPVDRTPSANHFLEELAAAGMPPEGPLRRRHIADTPTHLETATLPDRTVFLLLTDLSAAPQEVEAVLRAAAARYGAQIEIMADGRTFATLRETTSDLLRAAGRFALELRGEMPPDVPVVLAFATGGNAFARAIERAVTLLDDAEVEAAMTPRSNLLWLDADAAAILDDTFEIETHGASHRLCGER